MLHISRVGQAQNRSRLYSCGVYLLLWLGTAQWAAAQEFVLEVPGDVIPPSKATLAGSRLTIAIADGGSFVYLREPEHDPADQKYLAYYSAEANQYIRWPVTGTGAMSIGRPLGKVIDWTRSRMVVRPVGLRPAVQGPWARPRQTAAVVMGPQRIVVGEIEAGGRLQIFDGFDDRWKHRRGTHPPDTCVAGAPLKLWGSPKDTWPRALTVNGAGKLVEITKGSTLTLWPQPADAVLPPGADFTVTGAVGSRVVHVVDQKGKLWLLPETDKPVAIETRPGILAPGSEIAVRVGPQREIFLTDLRGVVVVYYEEAGKWQGPEFLAEGFDPGGSVAVWEPGAKGVRLAAVDRRGELRILWPGPAGWTGEVVPEARFLPGSPILAFAVPGGVNLTGIDAHGNWGEWYVSGGGWSHRQLASGFTPGTPLTATEQGPVLFGVDATGRMLAAVWEGDQWQMYLCLPGSGAQTQRLVERELRSHAPLEAVSVVWKNTSNEELLIKVLDRRAPDQVQEFRLPPGDSHTLMIERDSGGTLVEKFLQPTPPLGELRLVTREISLPPRVFYDVVVSAKRETYKYIDKRKKAGPLANFSEQSLVSSGAFPVPPGPVLQEGQIIDVPAWAAEAQNPGAAALLDPAAQPPAP